MLVVDNDDERNLFLRGTFAVIIGRAKNDGLLDCCCCCCLGDIHDDVDDEVNPSTTICEKWSEDRWVVPVLIIRVVSKDNQFGTL
jgi:hypothetical protein